MRTMPRTTRVAIATMFLRHRDMRRRHRECLATHGVESPATRAASVEEVSTWNALQSVISNVHETHPDGSPRMDAHEMMRVAALRGRRFRLNHPNA